MTTISKVKEATVSTAFGFVALAGMTAAIYGFLAFIQSFGFSREVQLALFCAPFVAWTSYFFGSLTRDVFFKNKD